MKNLKKIVAVSLALVTVCAIMMCSVSVSAADSYDKYTEFKGTVCVLSNFEADPSNPTNVSSPSGLADPLGKSLEAEEYGRDEDEYCGDVGTLDVSRDTTHFLEGKSSMKIHVAQSETLANAGNKTINFDRTTFQIRDIKNVKVTDPANTYLCFYMYVDKKTDFANLDLGNSAIEVCKEIDSPQEYQFLFSQLNAHSPIQDGWNKFEIPLNKMNNQLPNCDIFRVRIFIFSAGKADVDLYFDNMTLEYRKPAANTSSNTSSKTTITVPNASSNTSSTVSNVTADTSSVVSNSTADTSSVVAESEVAPEDTTSVADDSSESGGFPVWGWVVIGVVVLAVAAAAVWFLVIKKN
ncbi:MAG: hypothetical protein IJY56_01535 [Clostridia bacterium]|nr:hypothetical protein [Clostridia bacterium]